MYHSTMETITQLSTNGIATIHNYTLAFSYHAPDVYNDVEAGDITRKSWNLNEIDFSV